VGCIYHGHVRVLCRCGAVAFECPCDVEQKVGLMGTCMRCRIRLHVKPDRRQRPDRRRARRDRRQA
jgi:hypothetical protein